jgi:hypothetical protein
MAQTATPPAADQAAGSPAPAPSATLARVALALSLAMFAMAAASMFAGWSRYITLAFAFGLYFSHMWYMRLTRAPQGK